MGYINVKNDDAKPLIGRNAAREWDTEVIATARYTAFRRYEYF
jgi:hypothetical protein